MNLVPNISAKTFTLSAVTIGFLLIDELTPAEQNSLGNWFMAIGQVLCTNSAQQQVINNRSNTSTPYNAHIINDNNRNDPQNNVNEQIDLMKKVINAMKQEIDNLKKN